MENQISQLANQFSQALKTPGTFPGQTEQSQKGQMNVVTLRSGKQLEEPPTKEPSREVIEEAEANFISEIPSYAKFLKDMLSNKRKLEENTTVALNAECSAILQNTLPKKLGDPGSYSIPVKLGDIKINRVLCDLDRSVKFPLGVLEDIPLRVGKFFIPCDFVVMEMEEDVNIPIILGRPFLATAGAIIDIKKGKITFEVGDEKLEYSLLNVMGAPSTGDTIYQISQLSQQVNRLSTLQDQAKVQKEQCNVIFLRKYELFPKKIVEKVCIKEPRKDVKSKDVQGSTYVAPPANDEPMPFSQRNFVKGKDKVPPDGMFGYMKVNSIIRQVNKPMKESLGGIHEPHRGPPPPCNDPG
ncbi:uncharacterized protein LOC110720654 [Chenopodium quinoa]|uniref:uncharacterized protein LOC110720654 n=1 Tax=Chenopodium quinoa TaxID=63459 RepID=UPI000B76FAF6|nr:uncharacterized protein LOC110720654 [Chenopodium quinoa]